MVYESFNPGALNKVVVYDENGNEIHAFSGDDPTPAGSERGISLVKLNVKQLKVNRVRLYFKSPDVPGWNEIDAVGLLDVAGQTHWASSAKASSTFADQAHQNLASDVDLFAITRSDFRQADAAAAPSERVILLEQRVQKLEEELAAIKRALGQIGASQAPPRLQQ